jgi:predicted ATP-grasp superfamily ATP-dependent carboligase
MESALKKTRGVIVIGGYINGLGIVRSFNACKIPAGIILTKNYDIAHYSRCVSLCEKALEITESPELLTDVLARRSTIWKGWALFPSNDEALAAIMHCRQYLESFYPIIAPPNDAASYMLDKERMLNIAQSIGVPVPIFYGSADQATADRPDLRFPVIVKPIMGHVFAEHFGRKLFVAADRAELKKIISKINKVGFRCHVYDLVPGPDSHVYSCSIYMDKNGSPTEMITIRKLRQSPPFFGVARVAELVKTETHIREATIEMLRRIRFRGIAAAEYKLDPRDGTFRFLEMNGRSILANTLLRQAGMDLACLAWSDYINHQRATFLPRHWPGVWINLHADLIYSVTHGRKEKMRMKDFLAPYLRPKIEAVWSYRDPVPFIMQWARPFRHSTRKPLVKSPKYLS